METSLITLLVIAGLILASWWIFWREKGFYRRSLNTRQTTERILSEDALKHLHQCEQYHRKPTIQSIAGALNISGNQVTEIITNMETRKLLQFVGDEIKLTAAGREYALRIIRTHRLYERYLADETGYKASEWHEKADKFEHLLTEEDAEKLSAKLGNPTHDPHGDPIPTSDGRMIHHGGQALTSMNVDSRLRIVHIEDEPETVFAQLTALGLHPGSEIHLADVSPTRLRILVGDEDHLLAPIIAANISVLPIKDEPASIEYHGEKLTNLKPGETGEVITLSPAIRGVERRRFMDLGILPGTKIKIEMTSPLGVPTAYRIRDAVIALRSIQAQSILVSRLPEVKL